MGASPAFDRPGVEVDAPRIAKPEKQKDRPLTEFRISAGASLPATVQTFPGILAIAERNTGPAGDHCLLARIQGLQTDASRAKSSQHAELLGILR
jgi:hypothetical protein